MTLSKGHTMMGVLTLAGLLWAFAIHTVKEEGPLKEILPFVRQLNI